jgi:hypothetical protein
VTPDARLSEAVQEELGNQVAIKKLEGFTEAQEFARRPVREGPLCIVRRGGVCPSSDVVLQGGANPDALAKCLCFLGPHKQSRPASRV